jgi:hypothetical protein
MARFKYPRQIVIMNNLPRNAMVTMQKTTRAKPTRRRQNQRGKPHVANPSNLLRRKR